MTATLSFVVPAFNEEEALGATLDAIARAGDASGLPWEAVVVDNASTDATAAVAEARGARVVSEPHRQIARARNRGAREASGRFLVFVDADTLVSLELVRTAVEAMASGGAAAGGSVLSWEGGGSLQRTLLAPWNLASRRLGLAAGSFLFCLKEAWEGSGGFDERYYASEEIWFSLALRRWGKPRGLGFRILEGHPPRTSPRKFRGGALLPATAQFLVLNLCPWLLRRRWACFLWYWR